MNQDYFKRMWYVWYPVIIKIAVSGIITSMLMVVFQALSEVEALSTGGLGAMMENMRDMDAQQELQEDFARLLKSLEIPCGIASAVITIPVLGFFFHRDRKRERQRNLAVRKAVFWKYPAIFILAATLCLGLNNLIQLAGLAELSSSYEETMEVFYSPPLMLQLFYLVLLTPICEELTFRGLMFRRMREEYPFVQAALFSSLIFAFLHGNIVQAPYGFIMAMLFAYMYEKYGSLKAPVLGHMAANLFSVLGTQYGWFDWMFEDVMRVGIVTVLCAAVGSTMFVLIQRMESVLEIRQEEKREDERIRE